MSNFVDTLKKVLTNPEGFYSEMPTKGYKDPLDFAATNLIFLGLLLGILAYFFENPQGYGLIYFTFVMPIFMVICGIFYLFISGIIYFIFFKIFGGSGSYEGTVRILSYLSPVAIFACIPLIGWIIGLYGIWLNIVGGKHVHNLTTVKSAIAVLLLLPTNPWVIFMMYIVAVLLLN